MQNYISKYGYFGAIGFVILSVLLFIISFSSKDNIIIAAGIGLFKALVALAWIFALLVVVTLIVTTVAKVKVHVDYQRAITNEKEARKNPLHDENEVILKLKALDTTLDNVYYLPYAKRILEQMNDIKQLQKEFGEIVETSDNNALPIINNIFRELMSIRVHILNDAKSIYRRLIIAKDSETIESKLVYNEKLLNDASDLIAEANNYIDEKVPSTNVDLDNLVEALKELNALI